jgi:hypothetical protein
MRLFRAVRVRCVFVHAFVRNDARLLCRSPYVGSRAPRALEGSMRPLGNPRTPLPYASKILSAASATKSRHTYPRSSNG